MAETAPLTSANAKPVKERRAISKRQKTKIGVYIMTIICSVGFIAAGIVGLEEIRNTSLISINNVEIVSFAYTIITGIFVIVVLLPIPAWKEISETHIPFMYTFSGRAALFILLGPLQISTPVGITAGTISILNGFSYLIMGFILRNDPQRKSFFRPFEPDVQDAPVTWEYHGQELKDRSPNDGPSPSPARSISHVPQTPSEEVYPTRTVNPFTQIPSSASSSLPVSLPVTTGSVKKTNPFGSGSSSVSSSPSKSPMSTSPIPTNPLPDTELSRKIASSRSKRTETATSDSPVTTTTITNPFDEVKPSSTNPFG